MKREAAKLLAFVESIQKVIETSGETKFRELSGEEQCEIYDRFGDIGLEIHIDFFDKDFGYEEVVVGDVTARFYFCDEAECPYDMDLIINGECVSVQVLVQYLKNFLERETTIVNLTPNKITVYDAAGESVLQVILSSGVARAAQTREPLESINGIPVSKTGYGAVEGLPDRRDGVIYIVSVLTAQAAPDRKDLYIMDDLVRDEAGRILGCKALAQI